MSTPADISPVREDDPANSAEGLASTDADPRGPIEEPPRYLGPRRGWRPPGRRLAIAGAAILAVSAVAAISVVLGTSSSRQDQPGAGPHAVPGGPTAATAAGSLVTPTDVASPGQSASHPQSRSPSPPRYLPVSYEAEAGSNILTGAASVTDYPGSSGGKIVDNIGKWGPGAKRTGTIAFPNVAVPADGAYTLTLYAVSSTDAAAQTTVISVAGAATATVTLAGGSGCCLTTTVRVNLLKGTNTITFGNPDGRSPAIDKIVLST
jgi:hypothetical protein